MEDFISWVIRNSKSHITGTQLGFIAMGAELYIKYLEQNKNKKD